MLVMGYVVGGSTIREQYQKQGDAHHYKVLCEFFEEVRRGQKVFESAIQMANNLPIKESHCLRCFEMHIMSYGQPTLPHPPGSDTYGHTWGRKECVRCNNFFDFLVEA